MPPKTQSILIGGLIAALIGSAVSVLSQISGLSDPANSQSVLGVILGLFGCLVMSTSGLIATWHYTSENELTLSGSAGVGIGVLSGIVYAVTALALGFLFIAFDILPSPQETMDAIRETGAFDAAGAEQAESITELMVTWGFAALTIVGGVIMGIIGGAIGAGVFKRGSDSEIVEDVVTPIDPTTQSDE